MCGVSAIIDPTKSINVVPGVIQLVQLQDPRGELSCGFSSIVTDQQGSVTMDVQKVLGAAMDVLHVEDFTHIHSHAAIGHDRYATDGSEDLNLAQPFYYKTRRPDKDPRASFSLVYNGNSINTRKALAHLFRVGNYPQMKVDTEAIGRVIQTCLDETLDLRAALMEVNKYFEDGSYNLIILTENGDLGAISDPTGRHPFSYARNPDGTYAIASEDDALLHLHQRAVVKDINPGQLFLMKNGMMHPEIETVVPPKSAHCFFEWIYFARAWSTVRGALTSDAREESGRIMAELDQDMPKDAEVIYIPDSAEAAARGYAQGLGLRLRRAIDKNRGVGRTFIHREGRLEKAQKKYAYHPTMVRNRRVVCFDDSTVRGTTLEAIIELFKEISGPAEIHMRFASPPILSPCYDGIDFSTLGELVARQYRGSPLSPEEDVLYEEELKRLAKHFGVASIKFLPISAIPKITGKHMDQLCMGCVTGKYPTPSAQAAADLAEKKHAMEQNIHP